MRHNPIILNELTLSFPHKTCFEHLNIRISYGNRIGLTGQNGSGKSSLLKVIGGMVAQTSGSVYLPDDVLISYVPQIIDTFEMLSGAERFNKAMTKALSQVALTFCYWMNQPTT